MFGGSAKLNFRKMCKASTQATLCVLRVSATNAYEQIPDPKLTEEAWNLLSAGDTKRFRQRFGDAFVSGRYVGVEFYGVIRVEARSAERQREIASEIQAKYGTFVDGGGKVKIDQRTKSSEHRIEIFTFQRGGSIQVCQTLDELTALARHALDEGRSGRGYPHAVMLDPYEELKLPHDGASPIQVEAARRAIGRLLAHRDALERLQNEIDFVLRNEEWFVEPDRGALNKASRAISSEIDAVVERADVCSRDFERCTDYHPNYPDLVLPQRKVDSGVDSVTEGDVIMSSDAPAVFLIEHRTKRWVPDDATYLSRWTYEQLKILPAEVVNAIARGPDLQSVLAPLPSGVTEGDVLKAKAVDKVAKGIGAF
jgi:hypothetical protein